MQLKLYTIPIKNVSGAKAGMNGFLRGHRVLAEKKADEYRTPDFQR